MARTPVLGGFSLNLFGGGGVSESVFSIASQSKQNEAYLALVRVQTRWDAGEVSDADYLAAYETYANSFPEGSAERLNKESSLNKLRYTIERNVLVSKVNDGSKTLSDLLTFDQSKLDGLTTDSQEYRDRLDNVRTTQSQLLSEKADEVNTDYQNGKMTTAQLLTWYQDRLTDPLYANNPDLTKQVQDQVDTLKGRVIDERDAQMISDYQNGKITPTQFLNYATAARARYTAGTTAAKDWDQRIQQARDSAVETDLSFRYDLSQEWLSLSQFVQSNNAPSGGTSTSTSTRTILGADGKWHVVKSTTTKATAPTAAQQRAYAQRQIEVNAAKRRMHQIENKLAGLPGGYVTTNEMLSYYKHQRSQVAKGSREWYSIQQKIDSLQATKSSESVMSRQGIKISYGKGGGGTKASSRRRRWWEQHRRRFLVGHRLAGSVHVRDRQGRVWRSLRRPEQDDRGLREVPDPAEQLGQLGAQGGAARRGQADAGQSGEGGTGPVQAPIPQVQRRLRGDGRRVVCGRWRGCWRGLIEVGSSHPHVRRPRPVRRRWFLLPRADHRGCSGGSLRWLRCLHDEGWQVVDHRADPQGHHWCLVRPERAATLATPSHRYH